MKAMKRKARLGAIQQMLKGRPGVDQDGLNDFVKRRKYGRPKMKGRK